MYNKEEQTVFVVGTVVFVFVFDAGFVVMIVFRLFLCGSQVITVIRINPCNYGKVRVINVRIIEFVNLSFYVKVIAHFVSSHQYNQGKLGCQRRVHGERQ